MPLVSFEECPHMHKYFTFSEENQTCIQLPFHCDLSASIPPLFNLYCYFCFKLKYVTELNLHHGIVF